MVAIALLWTVFGAPLFAFMNATDRKPFKWGPFFVAYRRNMWRFVWFELFIIIVALIVR